MDIQCGQSASSLEFIIFQKVTNFLETLKHLNFIRRRSHDKIECATTEISFVLFDRGQRKLA